MKKWVAMVVAVSLMLSAGMTAQAANPSPCVRHLMQSCMAWQGHVGNGGHHGQWSGNGAEHDCIFWGVNVGEVCDNWERCHDFGVTVQAAGSQTAIGQSEPIQDAGQSQAAEPGVEQGQTAEPDQAAGQAQVTDTTDIGTWDGTAGTYGGNAACPYYESNPGCAGGSYGTGYGGGHHADRHHGSGHHGGHH